MKACAVSSKENALPVICLFVYCLSSDDQQMAASSVRTAWEQDWASTWSEGWGTLPLYLILHYSYQACERWDTSPEDNSTQFGAANIILASCYHLNINCVDGKPTLKRAILLQNEFSWKKLRCAFFHPRSNLSILQQISLLKVLWILTYDWINFAGVTPYTGVTSLAAKQVCLGSVNARHVLISLQK